jgi:hypothetical protein
MIVKTHAKLTVDQVKSIRADKRSVRKIAVDYLVCKSNISLIKRWLTWKHIKEFKNG